jgi:hypothetical protein
LHQPAGGNYAWGSPANNEVIMKSAPKLLLVLVFSDFDEEPLVLVLKNKLEWFWTSSPILQECKISVLVLGIVLQKRKIPILVSVLKIRSSMVLSNLDQTSDQLPVNL